MRNWLNKWWIAAALGAIVILIIRIRRAWKLRRQDEELIHLQ